MDAMFLYIIHKFVESSTCVHGDACAHVRSVA